MPGCTHARNTHYLEEVHPDHRVREVDDEDQHDHLQHDVIARNRVSYGVIRRHRVHEDQHDHLHDVIARPPETTTVARPPARARARTTFFSSFFVVVIKGARRRSFTRYVCETRGMTSLHEAARDGRDDRGDTL